MKLATVSDIHGNAVAFDAGGHTHVQFMRHLGRSFRFNPGSVGVAYRHDQPQESFRVDRWAEYALLTVRRGAGALEFRRVPFDVARHVEAFRASGHPHAGEMIGQYGG